MARVADDDPVTVARRRRRRALLPLGVVGVVGVAGLAVALVGPVASGHDSDPAARFRTPPVVAGPAGLGVGPAVIAPASHRPGAPSALGPVPSATASRTERTQLSVLSTIVAGRLLFVGASYSIGLGATGRAAAYPTLLADRLHRRLTVNAVSGTGFQNPGPTRAGTFEQRIARLPTVPAPRIVVIQGGRDDDRYPISREYAAVLATIEAAEHRFTTAQVVVLGPIPASLPVSERALAINTAIGRACAAARAGFVNALGQRWITPDNVHHFAGHIRGHPNDAGYAYIATKLMAALPGALQAARPPLHGPALSTNGS